jgi:hypothetical protein
MAGLALALAACSDGGGDADASAPKPGDKGACTTAATLHPSEFVDPTLDTNTYHPTKPGLQWVRGGTTEVGRRVVPSEIISTMTDVIRVIDGIPTIAMLDEDIDSGEVSQLSIDYLALDRKGNVWILGGYTEEFEAGEFTNSEDHWLGVADGTTVGVLAPAVVTRSTPTWCIGSAPGDDPTVGSATRVGVRKCVSFDCYDNVRVVQEGAFSAPDNEDKYYAPGVGPILNVPLDASLHQDSFQLLNFRELSPQGLDEASTTVLDLEAHARKIEPEVFASTPVSERAS